MSRFTRYLVFFILCVQIPALSCAQTFNQYVKNGDREFAAGDYYAASVYYGKAMELNNHRIDINYKFAQASRLFNDYEPAAEAYGQVVKDDNYLNFPLAEFWQAVMFKYMGNYDQSLRHFKRFLSRYRQQGFYRDKAQHEVEQIDVVRRLALDTLAVEIEHMGSHINTPYTEFAAFEIRDSLLQFSSIREQAEGSTEEEDYRSRIYTFFYADGTWKEDKKLFAGLNASDKHIANGTWSPDMRTFFFTVCDNIHKSELLCGIYQSSYRNGRWGQPLALNINLPCCTSTQPSVGKDGEGNELLFFASDRAGSKGKLDIWMAEKVSEARYQEPVNLGNVINTPDDEATPFYDSKTQTLYFSSKWHAGLGGYDIFKTRLVDGEWTVPENLGYPLNTSYNDLYYTINSEVNQGYLTSNRLGSLYIKGETCCNDIFRFQLEKEEADTPMLSLQEDTVFMEADTTVEIVRLSSDTTRAVIGKVDTTLQSSRADVLIGKMRDLLPITLYFHNDEPDCCTMSDSTGLNYKKTYEAYSSILYQYIEAYGKSKVGEERDSAEAEIIDFFENYVDRGMIDLYRFTTLLSEALQVENRKLKVTIEGYCSPLAVNPYNINLAKRRIASLRNYFYNYRKGMLNPYLSSGQLRFVHEPIGEEQAPEGISDSPLDVQNSIYSPEAALERRVYIIAIDAN